VQDWKRILRYGASEGCHSRRPIGLSRLLQPHHAASKDSESSRGSGQFATNRWSDSEVLHSAPNFCQPRIAPSVVIVNVPCDVSYLPLRIVLEKKYILQGLERCHQVDKPHLKICDGLCCSRSRTCPSLLVTNYRDSMLASSNYRGIGI